MSRFSKETCRAFLVAGLLTAACGGEERPAGDAEPAKAEAAGKTEEKIPIGDAGRRMYFEKRCRDGHAGLCGELGLMWEKGYGGPKDRKKADEFYRLACDQAVLKSCEAIGAALTPEKELEILGKSCDAGSSFACNNRGQILLAGREGQPPEPEKALSALEKGCSGGYASSCRSLAYAYRAGMGAAADEARASAYDTKAAEADAVISALEAKYLGTLPHDQQPIGRASQLTLDLASASAQQAEASKKAMEKAAAETAKAGEVPPGGAPAKP